MIDETLQARARQIRAFGAVYIQAAERIIGLNALMPAAAELGGILSTTVEAVQDGIFSVTLEPEMVMRYLKAEIAKQFALCESYDRKARQIIEILNEA